MERLTTRSILGGWTLKVPRQEAVDRLAAYEDTGLEPEEIVANMEMFFAYRHVYGGCPPGEISVLVKVREIVVETAADREYIDYICPKCGDIISQRRKGQKGGVYMPNYHDRCGQRLDWTRAEAEAAIGGGGDG